MAFAYDDACGATIFPMTFDWSRMVIFEKVSVFPGCSFLVSSARESKLVLGLCLFVSIAFQGFSLLQTAMRIKENEEKSPPYCSAGLNVPSWSVFFAPPF